MWWVTIVDAALVCYRPGAYDAVLASQPPARHRLTEETLAGLRFVRNQLGQHADPAQFIRAADHRRAGRGRGTGWIWARPPEAVRTPRAPDGQEWEMARYRAYQMRLAGHSIAESFALTTGFLTQAAAVSDPASAPAAR